MGEGKDAYSLDFMMEIKTGTSREKGKRVLLMEKQQSNLCTIYQCQEEAS